MAQDYKETMNLPKTDFAMRAGLPKNEPLRLQKWQDLELYSLVLKKNANNPAYILHDGPPYANGPLHMGHAFNKVLKDIIVKYKSQRGFYSPYVPGWDCHGQPIEHMVETTLGQEKMAKISQPELRKLCRDWATRFVDEQRKGFIRLGVTGDWTDPYLTYTPAYEAGNVEIFKAMYASGAIYRGRKPIHWCCHCHTALAEAEIEYGDEISPSIYVAFKLADNLECLSQPLSEVSILIWTTTPWTLPANVAVSVASEADYVIVDTGDKALILAQALLEEVAQKSAWETITLVKDNSGAPVVIKGCELGGIKYEHPIHTGMQGVIVTGEHVDLSTGTGAVHTAPGHGQEDYLIGEQYDLPMLMPVDANGVFDSGGGPFEGLDVSAANPQIIAWLSERGTLIAKAMLTHSYPHCWRCHNPVIFRATDQWFVSMDETGLRQNALEELDRLNWYPEWAINRLSSMVANRPDWCISRQRAWGVPIPVFKCARCSQTVATPQTFDAVIELFKNEGADAWFTHDPADYLPEGTSCAVCGCTELVPEKDILDVWWESGVSHTSVLEVRPELHRPADLYLEGSDQHRGWFQSSLLTSVGAYGLAPYKGVMSCGFVVDGEGRKMAKSLGNGVDPAEVIAGSGADVLRLWVGSVDYSQDVGISDEIIQRTSESYRRIRNTFRFLLSNLYDFNADLDPVTWQEMNELDRWALCRLHELMETVTSAYDAFRFHVAYHAIYDYVVTDLSAVYLDALKDRLYSESAKSVARRSAQTVLLNVLEVLVRQLAPILTFTCDEVWDYYPVGICTPGREPAVQLAGWPYSDDFLPSIPASESARILADYKTVLEVRDAVTKALEEARNEKIIGKSQEATVVITAPATTVAVLKSQSLSVLEELFIVAEVSFAEAEAEAATSVQIQPATGTKCPRCWNIRTVGTDQSYPELCARCAGVLHGYGR
ncbi:MAG: isoleucine--tRNA ligase [Coriobacteriaceae bacterium]|nr:isoleucine--tRNA ligase [Coriobacteriaceae bacterium]